MLIEGAGKGAGSELSRAPPPLPVFLKLDRKTKYILSAAWPTGIDICDWCGRGPTRFTASSVISGPCWGVFDFCSKSCLKKWLRYATKKNYKQVRP